MRVLEIKPGSSRRTASAWHCWATSPLPSPPVCFKRVSYVAHAGLNFWSLLGLSGTGTTNLPHCTWLQAFFFVFSILRCLKFCSQLYYFWHKQHETGMGRNTKGKSSVVVYTGHASTGEKMSCKIWGHPELHNGFQAREHHIMMRPCLKTKNQNETNKNLERTEEQSSKGP